MNSHLPPRLSRRTILTGGAAALVLAGCGSSNKGGAGTASDSGGGATGGRALVALFGQDSVMAGRPQRIAFAIGDSQGALISGGPSVLDLELSVEGHTVGRLRGARHRDGLPRAYYPIELAVPKAGFYTVKGTVGREPVEAAFQVVDKVALPQVGDRLPVIDTPTTADHRGVDPICSRNRVCPFHRINARDVIGKGKPVALLVSTPAFCQVEICGPVLDLLVAEGHRRGTSITCIHTEVYRSGKAAAANLASAQLAPAVQALRLPFEPCLFVLGPDGRVKVRLDNIFDAVELRQALEAATA